MTGSGGSGGGEERRKLAVYLAQLERDGAPDLAAMIRGLAKARASENQSAAAIRALERHLNGGRDLSPPYHTGRKG